MRWTLGSQSISHKINFLQNSCSEYLSRDTIWAIVIYMEETNDSVKQNHKKAVSNREKLHYFDLNAKYFYKKYLEAWKIQHWLVIFQITLSKEKIPFVLIKFASFFLN